MNRILSIHTTGRDTGPLTGMSRVLNRISPGMGRTDPGMNRESPRINLVPRNYRFLLAALLLTARIPMVSALEYGKPAGKGYVAVEEHLGSYLPSGLFFTAEDSARIRLLDLIDRPAVIAPVYYECPGLCTPIMDGMAGLFNRTDLEMGKDYLVFNISFRESETPELAVKKKRNYSKLLTDPEKGEYWHFMTGDSANIGNLLQALGYSMIRHGKDILHPAAIMIVDPHGKIVKYLQGTQFNPVEFKMAIEQAAVGQTMPSITRVLKMCFNYEPAGREKVRTSTILGFILMICVAAILMIAFPPLRNKN